MIESPYIPTQRFELHGRDYPPDLVTLMHMNETSFIPSVRFDRDKSTHRTSALSFFMVMLGATPVIVSKFGVLHIATLNTVFFFFCSCYALFHSFREGKGLAFNEDGISYNSSFIAWADISAYYFTN